MLPFAIITRLLLFATLSVAGKLKLNPLLRAIATFAYDAAWWATNAPGPPRRTSNQGKPVRRALASVIAFKRGLIF